MREQLAFAREKRETKRATRIAAAEAKAKHAKDVETAELRARVAELKNEKLLACHAKTAAFSLQDQARAAKTCKEYAKACHLFKQSEGEFLIALMHEKDTAKQKRIALCIHACTQEVAELRERIDRTVTVAPYVEQRDKATGEISSGDDAPSAGAGGDGRDGLGDFCTGLYHYGSLGRRTK